MITKIIHRIWNERRQNIWLFIELIVASIFLWLAIDPLFTLVCRNNIPRGYDVEKVYQIKPGTYYHSHPKFRRGETNSETMATFMQQLKATLSSTPEIENWCMVGSTFEPNSLSYAMYEFHCDSTETPDGKSRVFQMRVYDIPPEYANSFFETLKIRNAITREVMTQMGNRENINIYVSRSAALKFYDTIDIVGRKIYNDRAYKNGYNIIGVIEDIQMLNYDEYTPVVFLERSEGDIMGIDGFRHNIVFKLKESVDEDSFIKKFNEEIAPKIAAGNHYCSEVKSYKEILQQHNIRFGITNKYRLFTGLSGFALFCAFMGVFSTFWIRANSRRRDIGIMRCMGATNGSIARQFTLEAMILVTLAFIVALPLLTHYIYIEGFVEPLAKVPSWVEKSSDYTPNTEYLHNRTGAHFAIVSLVCYLFITAIAAIGSLIPAVRIARSLPADTLREQQ